MAYVATILQPLAPALRLGVLVASPSLVRAARALRRITTRHPPLIAQRTAAHLLALGHYEKIMARVGAAFRQRLLALRDALNHYLVHLIDIPPVRGGTAYWVTGPDHMDVRELAIAAEAQGRADSAGRALLLRRRRAASCVQAVVSAGFRRSEFVRASRRCAARSGRFACANAAPASP